MDINGYSQQVIKQSKQVSRTQKKTKRKHTKEDIMYFKFEYISDKINTQIKHISKKEGFNIRLAQRSKTLRNVLKKHRPVRQGNCNMKNRNLNDEMKCLKKNVIYQMKCTKCNNTYIGSTIRPLHQRIREHLQTTTSSVYKHKIMCKGQFSTNILATAKDTADLRLKEAIYIKKNNPSINNKQECEAFKDFLFF